jgi:hypothetical protein
LSAVWSVRSGEGMFSQGQPEQAVLEWCLPVVHDCLREFYVRRFALRSAAFTRITQLHFKFWTSLVRGDFVAARADVAILFQEARRLKVDCESCGSADRYIAAELLELLLRRFRRMPVEAKQNNQALLAVLLHLNQSAAPARLAASSRRAA